MSNDALISVVIPVYNGERYLADCLRSVLLQCREELEVIVADDGSTDATPTILAEFAAVDPRIIRLQTNHSGASAARNAALARAQGEWVMFVDADDQLLSPCLLQAVADCTDTSVDIVTFETSSDDSDLADARDAAVFARHRCTAAAAERTAEQRVLDPAYLGPKILNESLNTVWNKAYRRAVLVGSDARFPVGIHLGEDLLFNLAVARAASTGCHLSLLGYYYRRDNSESATRRFIPEKHDELMHVNDALLQFACELGSIELISAAGFIRAKNAVSSTRDLHHRQCPFPMPEKLAAARRYRHSAAHVLTRGLGPVHRMLGTAYNLSDSHLLFLLTGVLAAQNRRAVR